MFHEIFNPVFQWSPWFMSKNDSWRYFTAMLKNIEHAVSAMSLTPLSQAPRSLTPLRVRLRGIIDSLCNTSDKFLVMTSGCLWKDNQIKKPYSKMLQQIIHGPMQIGYSGKRKKYGKNLWQCKKFSWLLSVSQQYISKWSDAHLCKRVAMPTYAKE